MATPNRTSLIAKTHKVLKKHYEAVTPPQRSLMEHLLYGCLLENSSPVAADEVFARLQQSYFDWNEMRVTTPPELAESMQGLSDPLRSAVNFRRVLQGVFEAHYSFDLEPLKKQNLGKAQSLLEKYCDGSKFAVYYAVQQGLSGHAIPLDAGAHDVLWLVGVTNDAEFSRREAPGLERAIPKNKGSEFSSLLHQLAADFTASPGSQRVKTILQEIFPEAKERLKARQARLEAEAVAKEAARLAAEKARQERQRAAEKAAAEKAAAEKAAAEKKALDRAAAEKAAAERAARKAAQAKSPALPAKPGVPLQAKPGAAPPAKPAAPHGKASAAPPHGKSAAASPSPAKGKEKEKPREKDRKPAAPPPKSPPRKVEPAKSARPPAKHIARKKPR